MHGTNVTGTFDEKQLKEQLTAVKTETARIAYYLSENCNMALNEVQNMIANGTSLTAQEALECGIVQSIEHIEIPQDGISQREDIVIIN